MSQRKSGYERKPADLYPTPPWVTECLLPHIPVHINEIWEPAAGTGEMADILGLSCPVRPTDICQHGDFILDGLVDFLQCTGPVNSGVAIITNPPYSQAAEFIERALLLTSTNGGMVAMLLRTDFDHAKTRRHLFADCPAFAKKIVLTKRIKWFEGGSSPSFNHAWFIWDWTNKKPPTIAYEPSEGLGLGRQ